MSICVIAPIHDFNDIRVVRKELFSAVTCGFECTLICASNRFSSHEFCNVVTIGPPTSILRRIFNIFVVLYKAISVKADLYHCHNPDAAIIALFLSVLGKSVIYETHEDFSSRILSRTWIPRPFRYLLSVLIDKLELLTSRKALATIVTQNHQVPKYTRSVLVQNLPITSSILPPKFYDSESPFILCYVGGISKERDIDKLLDILESLNAQSHQSFRLRLAGPCSGDYLFELQSHRAWDFVDYLGFTTQDKVSEVISSSHLGLLLLQDRFDFQQTSPNKLYEYCIGGIPFLASSFINWKNLFNGCCYAHFVDANINFNIIYSINEIVRNYNTLIETCNINDFLIRNSWHLEFEKIKLLYNESI